MTAVPPTRRELTEVLREIAWTVHRRAPERAGVGPLPTTEIALLKQVISTPGATVGQLAEALGLRQPNASAAIRVLADKGLVTKEPSLDDRRIVRIVPTGLGSSEHAEIAAAWTQPLEAAIATLSEEHQEALDAAGGALVALLATLTRSDQA